jgi:plastocyanin
MVSLEDCMQPCSVSGRNVLLFAAVVAVVLACGCAGNPSPTPATPASSQAPGGNAVTVQNFAFSPANLQVAKGTTVTWTNRDAAEHQVASDAAGTIPAGGLFQSPALPDGGAYSFTFNDVGTFPYHCTIHPSMKGTITVD